VVDPIERIRRARVLSGRVFSSISAQRSTPNRRPVGPIRCCTSPKLSPVPQPISTTVAPPQLQRCNGATPVRPPSEADQVIGIHRPVVKARPAAVDFVDLLGRREVAPAQGWISIALGTRKRPCGEVPLKLLDMFHGLLAFHLERHRGASEMDHRAKLSSVLPKRSNGAISKLVPFRGGTEGSNPSPSSGESRENR
jgi:hypothetical protein